MPPVKKQIENPTTVFANILYKHAYASASAYAYAGVFKPLMLMEVLEPKIHMIGNMRWDRLVG